MLTGVPGGIVHSLKIIGLSGDTRGSLEVTGFEIRRPSDTTAERYGNSSSCCRDTDFSELELADLSSILRLWSISGFARRWNEMVVSTCAVVYDPAATSVTPSSVRCFKLFSAEGRLLSSSSWKIVE
jgi:hypothetical protein